MPQVQPPADRIAYGFEHESWESKVDWFGALTPAGAFTTSISSTDWPWV